MGGWSDIPAELLREITRKLDVIDVVRTGAVCTWWSKVKVHEKYALRSQNPWLMFSPEPKSDSQCNLRYMYSMTEKKFYEFVLPCIAGYRCHGSSHGYLLSVDSNANLVATNPLKPGSRLPLPLTASMFFGVVRNDSYPIKMLYGKAILSPDRKTAVASIWPGYSHCYARTGDKCWKKLYSVGGIEDFIFHQDRLCAVTKSGDLYIYDLSHGSEQIIKSAEGPIPEDTDFEEYGIWTYLVESPCGEHLFLVFRFSNWIGHQEDIKFKVFTLDKSATTTTWKWKQINTLEDISFFLGFNYSMALCARELPGLKKNCIYFTSELVGDNGVFSLDDGSVKPLYEDNNLDQLEWQQPVWFFPTML